MKKKYSTIIYKFFIPLVAFTGFSSCNDYLDEMPSKTTSALFILKVTVPPFTAPMIIT